MLVDFPPPNNFNIKNGDNRIYETDGHLNLLNKNQQNLVVFNNIKQQQVSKQSKQNFIFCFCKICGYRYIILLLTVREILQKKIFF